jgi:hypothetical protein
MAIKSSRLLSAQAAGSPANAGAIAARLISKAAHQLRLNDMLHSFCAISPKRSPLLELRASLDFNMMTKDCMTVALGGFAQRLVVSVHQWRGIAP